MLLRCGFKTLDLSTPVVMGVVNVTPDSFSDGGRYTNVQAALAHARQMMREGAGIIDVGGESTRPGATPVGVDQELERVIPVIEAIRSDHDVVISVDTSKPEVMRAATAAGAGLINDIRALTEPGALQAAAESTAGVCVMHMQGQPATMQQAPQYSDVLDEVGNFLMQRVVACEQAGIVRDRIVLDPGIGFGKALEHNLRLLAHLPKLTQFDLPLLIGASRKTLIGKILDDRPVDQRLYGGLAIAVASVLAGASIIRTHDVAATCDAIRMAHALKQAGYVTELRTGNR